MPHWNDKGEEEWVCQKGTHICTGESVWVHGLGNVCRLCLATDNRMTAKGRILRLEDSATGSKDYWVIAIGDRVKLPGDYEGTIHSWTKRGVMVVIDAPTESGKTRPVTRHTGMIVAAVDCGDDEIVSLLPKKE